MSSTINSAQQSSHLSWMMRTLQAEQKGASTGSSAITSGGDGFSASASTDSAPSGSASSSQKTTSTASASDVSNPFQQLSSQLQNMLLELQSVASGAGNTNTAATDSSQTDPNGEAPVHHHHRHHADLDGDESGSQQNAGTGQASTANNPFSNGNVQSDITQLLTALQNAGSTATNAAVTKPSQSATSTIVAA